MERRLVSVHRERFPEATRTVLAGVAPPDRSLVEARVIGEYGIPALVEHSETRADLRPRLASSSGGCGSGCRFDAGLVGPGGSARPVYRVFASKLRGYSR
jgi:hypothetical protein